MAGVAARTAALDADPLTDFSKGLDPLKALGGHGGNARTGNDHSSDLQASTSAAAATLSSSNAPGVNAVAAVHSHALQQGRHPLANAAES